MAGFVVLSLYLLIGTGLWVFVLQSQPFPSPATLAGEGQASKGGSTLLQDHPQVSLPEEAKKLLAELAEKANAAPQEVKTWKTLAEAQSRAARLDSSYRSAALSSYRHVLDLAPNDLDALRGVGNVYYDFEEYAKAIEYYQQYLALNPEDPSVRTDLGTMYLYTNDADRAIAEYQTVLAKKPDFFQAHFNLGIAYQEKGEPDEARQSLARAKALTADKNIQTKIDEVIAQFGGTSSPTPTVASPPTSARSPFQQAVEKLFRGHEIMGPRISRIEWLAPAEAHVFFQNFPMSAMPQEVRERFLGKLRTQVTEAKSANSISSMAKIELIDADTNQIMETITT
ncbi:MAG TPA: tetratricopeptide repeat protein [Candidatus Binatia bacterium]|nr:tetratricopeptide repeat protein [Candidatus Binatia bacterium]